MHDSIPGEEEVVGRVLVPAMRNSSLAVGINAEGKEAQEDKEVAEAEESIAISTGRADYPSFQRPQTPEAVKHQEAASVIAWPKMPQTLKAKF